MRLDRLIRAGAVAGFAYLALAWLTTQIAPVRAALPFTEDPYDLVTSFAVIAIVIVGGATGVRWLAHARGPRDPAVERRIGLGAALVTLIATVGVASDVVGVVLVGLPDVAAPTAVGVGLVLLASIAVVVALGTAWRARTELRGDPSNEAEPDLIDDIESIGVRLGAGRVVGRLDGWIERSRFSPRRHRLAVGVLGAFVAGLGAIVWHAIREGAWASPGAALVFGGLMALGVIGAYLLGLAPLRLIRSNS